MDGGVADTAAAVQHNARAWSPDPQERGSLSLWTGAWPTQLLLNRPLIGGEGEGGSYDPRPCSCACVLGRARRLRSHTSKIGLSLV